MRKLYFILILLSLWNMLLHAQEPNIGLLEIDHDKISEGYTLFCPWNSQDFYLIDNCGEKINTWNTNLMRNLKMAYLDDEGDFSILNGSEHIKYDWNSNKIWHFNSLDYGLLAHHDMQIMPNGNFIVIATEFLPHEEAIQLGFDTIGLKDQLIAIDGLYEFAHVQDNDFELVWKWNFKDHLVQEVDSTLDNYGQVNSAARKLNTHTFINPDFDDWLHCNGVDYNETLDQLIISSRNTSEIYIIDHSTTIEEAAGPTGGNGGFGGDFLWRWGNTNLNEQHDPNWIPTDHPNGGKISVFNNLDGTSDDPFSSIKIIDPPVDAQGKYILDTLNQFLPQESNVVISGEEHNIFSQYMSGAHSLENGNFFICLGRTGEFYELTSEGDKVWKYRNPVYETPLEQFEPALTSFTFNVKKYPIDFIGFQNKDLTPKGLIENLNPLSEICSTYTTTEETSITDLSVFPNPSTGDIFYSCNEQILKVQIFALSGKKIKEILNPNQLIDVQLEKGSYLFRFELKDQAITKLISILH